MKVVFLSSAPPPKIPGTDAVHQEMTVLADTVSGEIVHLHPFENPAWRFPMAAMGLTRLPQILSQAAKSDVVHVINPTLYAFPFLRMIKKPIVYTVSASLGPAVPLQKTGFLDRLAAVVVSNTRDEVKLKQLGLTNVCRVNPGHDLSKFAKLRKQQERPDGGQIKLISASAPWTLSQFETKGIDALLAGIAASSRLALTLVMRGSFREMVEQKIGTLAIADRVTVLDGAQDIAALMTNLDCAVLAATTPDVVKAWPHSLLEALAAGRPVIVSGQLPISDFVEKSGCGIVLETVNAGAIAQAAEAIADDPEPYFTATKAFRWKDFSPEVMIQSYRAIYRAAAERGQA